jgi:pyruvate dehydrogenase kinase 2/3/4
MLALGLSLSSKHLDSDQLDMFMKRMLVSRISRRVLAEHHISLSTAHHHGDSPSPNQVGIIVTDLGVKDSIDRCLKILKDAHETESRTHGSRTAAFPSIEIDGHVETRFSYIKVRSHISVSGDLPTPTPKEHLDYVILELLNNVRAN